MILRSFKTIWRTLSIRNKQLIFFAGLIAIVSTISFYSQYTLNTYLDQFQVSLDGYFTINTYLLDIKRIRGTMGKQMREGSIESLRDYMSAKEGLVGLLERIDRESNTSLETYFLLRALKNGQTVYFEKCLQAIDNKQQGVETYYRPYYASERIGDFLEGYTSALLNVRLSEGNWYFQHLAEKVAVSRVLMLLLLVFISLLCIAFAVLFSNSLTRPIRKLASASIRMSGGDLEVRPIDVASQDEIGVLAHSFNVMSGSIQRMVGDLREKADVERKLHEEERINLSMQRSLREAQFLSLQSQINPHFLFNTLNTLSRKAVLEGAESTADLIRSLSSLFRYSFRKHGHSVKLREELDFVEEYLHIQNQRFGDRIHYSILCALDADEVEVPCFTLQPIVENSILHGLEPKEKGGHLRIKISRFNGRVHIRILDTGMGMSSRRKDEVLSSEEGKGIGILNVAARLGLFFNGREEFILQSKPNRGTLVTMSFPWTGEVDEHDV